MDKAVNVMPYFITNKAPSCNGWATVKGDGEVMGCHTSKGAAVKQMVAVSLAEKMQPGGERAFNNELEVGDFVIWDNAGHEMFGLITNVSTYGIVKSQLGATMLATQDRPLATIVIYELSDMDLIETDQFVIKDFAPLTKVGKIKDSYHDEGNYHDEGMSHDESMPDETGYERVKGGAQAVILDIDDTLMHFDKPMLRVIEYVNKLPGRKYIITGRMQSDRERTIKQLDDVGVEYSALFMKQADEPTSTFKRRVAQKLLQRFDVYLAIDNDENNRQAFSDLGIATMNPASIKENQEPENREINANVPQYMRAAARRGLEYVADGKAGDGLKQQTINEARKMASGEISDDKWIRMAAWIARHLGDLDSPEADPQHPNYPSPGVVAHLLWGSGPSKTKARAAMQYAEGVVERIRNEQKRHLPGGHYQKLHGGGGDRNSYMAGNWKQATESEKKDIVREKYAEAAKYTKFNDQTLTPEQKAEKLAQADGQWESRTTNATVYRNGGHTVTFSAKVDSKTQKQILKNVDDLQEKAPLDEIDIQVVSKFNTTVAQKMPRGYAYTTENGKSIIIKSTTAKNNDLYVNPESHPNWHMESSSNTSVSRYVMVHEWGHAVSKQSGGKLDETKVKLAVARGTTAGGTMSEYGSKSAGEAYAEGFAEFFNTDGKSENPVVQELAKEFNW